MSAHQYSIGPAFCSACMRQHGRPRSLDEPWVCQCGARLAATLAYRVATHYSVDDPARRRLRMEGAPCCVLCGERGVHWCRGGKYSPRDLEAAQTAPFIHSGRGRPSVHAGLVDARALGIDWFLLEQKMLAGERLR